MMRSVFRARAVWCCPLVWQTSRCHSGNCPV